MLDRCHDILEARTCLDAVADDDWRAIINSSSRRDPVLVRQEGRLMTDVDRNLNAISERFAQLYSRDERRRTHPGSWDNTQTSGFGQGSGLADFVWVWLTIVWAMLEIKVRGALRGHFKAIYRNADAKGRLELEDGTTRDGFCLNRRSRRAEVDLVGFLSSEDEANSHEQDSRVLSVMKQVESSFLSLLSDKQTKLKSLFECPSADQRVSLPSCRVQRHHRPDPLLPHSTLTRLLQPLLHIPPHRESGSPQSKHT